MIITSIRWCSCNWAFELCSTLQEMIIRILLKREQNIASIKAQNTRSQMNTQI